MLKTTLTIIDKKENRQFDWDIYYPEKPLWFIDCIDPNGEFKRFKGNDLFDCLCELRKTFQRNSWFILCNGVRIDSYPSGMSRDMGGAKKVYINKLGLRPERIDLVKIFDEAPLDNIGTVDEQIAYHKLWLESLGF